MMWEVFLMDCAVLIKRIRETLLFTQVELAADK